MSNHNMTTTQQRQAYRCLVSQTNAPKTSGEYPYAAPFAKLNDWASRLEPTFINPVRDVPRIHNAAGVPLWAVLPPPIVQPVTEASRPAPIARFFADFAQIGVDVTVGACALGAALGLLLMLRPAQAKEVLFDHATLILTTFNIVFVLACCYYVQKLLPPT